MELSTRVTPEPQTKVAASAAEVRNFRAKRADWDTVMLVLLDLMARRRSPWHVRNLGKAGRSRCVGDHEIVDLRWRAARP
jgi:hypothetical protein